jgi:hypothetical protein
MLLCVGCMGHVFGFERVGLSDSSTDKVQGGDLDRENSSWLNKEAKKQGGDFKLDEENSSWLNKKAKM